MAMGSRGLAFFSGWRGLWRFWAVTAALLITGGVTLQLLGPPANHGTAPAALAKAADRTSAAPTQPVPATQPGGASRPIGDRTGTDRPPDDRSGTGTDRPPDDKSGPARTDANQPGRDRPGVAGPRIDQPGRDTPGPAADPDPALLEPSPTAEADMLPRVALDGRHAHQVYAAGFDRGTRRARVGLILAGIGMHEADSLAAARELPGGVTLAFSPNALNFERVLSATRLAGHEFLVSLPLEPTGYPIDDPGPRTC